MPWTASSFCARHREVVSARRRRGQTRDRTDRSAGSSRADITAHLGVSRPSRRSRNCSAAAALRSSSSDRPHARRTQGGCRAKPRTAGRRRLRPAQPVLRRRTVVGRQGDRGAHRVRRGARAPAGHGGINGPGHQAVLADTDGDVRSYHYYPDSGPGEQALRVLQARHQPHRIRRRLALRSSILSSASSRWQV